MYCFEIYNKTTKETRLIFGYSAVGAFRRANITDPENWQVIQIEYED